MTAPPSAVRPVSLANAPSSRVGLAEALARRAASDPSLLLVRDNPERAAWDGAPPRAMTAGDLNELVDRLAARIARWALEEDAAVAIASALTVEAIAAALAVERAGRSVLILSPLAPPEAWAGPLQAGRAGAIVASARLGAREPLTQACRVALNLPGVARVVGLGGSRPGAPRLDADGPSAAPARAVAPPAPRATLVLGGAQDATIAVSSGDLAGLGARAATAMGLGAGGRVALAAGFGPLALGAGLGAALAAGATLELAAPVGADAFRALLERPGPLHLVAAASAVEALAAAAGGGLAGLTVLDASGAGGSPPRVEALPACVVRLSGGSLSVTDGNGPALARRA